MLNRKYSIDNSFSSSESLTSLTSYDSVDTRSWSIDSDDKSPMFVIGENNFIDLSKQKEDFSNNTDNSNDTGKDISNNIIKRRRQRDQTIKNKYRLRVNPSPTIESLKKIIESFDMKDENNLGT